MMFDDKTRKEFEEAAAPLIAFLQKNCHPHMCVVVQYDSAELCEGQIAVNFSVPD